ncbi:MAG: hypothetical protein JSW04_12785 [Desulfobacterales bacterium]|nr:MAG: hypothetical protein JSV38_16410 [Desulfobacterales bacterium]UCD89284.1 MAG: hypothetical protein JSW04_12785 [Desulfobacterales bacterium]
MKTTDACFVLTVTPIHEGTDPPVIGEHECTRALGVMDCTIIKEIFEKYFPLKRDSKSRTISQDNGIEQLDKLLDKARGMDAPSQRENINHRQY